MTGTALVLFLFSDLPGAWLGPASLVTGVLVEAVAARWMGAVAIRRTMAAGDGSAGTAGGLSYRAIFTFYYPLALMSVSGLATHPMLALFMARAHAPLESLAVFPVIGALSFMFRAIGISYQEAAIALLGKDVEHRRAVGRFARGARAGVRHGAGALCLRPPLRVLVRDGVGADPGAGRLRRGTRPPPRPPAGALGLVVLPAGR